MANVIAVEVKAKLQWQARQSPTSRRWIGVCEAMSLAMEADSLDELHSIIPEAIHLMMIDLLEDNELDAFLREKGWTAKNLERARQMQDVHFEVPWQLIAEGARDSERRTH